MASPAAPKAPLPLSALRERLDRPAGTTWLADADGGVGRALAQPAGTRVSFPIALTAATGLTGRARLDAREWRDGTGSVRVWITATTADGGTRELWTGVLETAAAGGFHKGRGLACELPVDTRELTLGVDQHRVIDGRSAAAAMWVELTLGERHSVSEAADDRHHRPLTAAPPTAEPAELGHAGAAPRFSVLTPVHDPPLEMLHEAVASVIAQDYRSWELQLIDDGSRRPDVIAALRRYAHDDPRIHLHRNERAQGIADATNTGLRRARGEYIALLDHDDTLAPEALGRVAATIASDPEVDMIYSDEDIVMDGRQIWVHRKQAWSPDVLRTNGYTCHLGVYRRTLVEQIGAFRSEFNGSQDVDMILRFVEQTDRVAHIPEILYHWRAHAASTAGGDAKPYAYVAARDAIAAHLERLQIRGSVDFGPPGLYRVVHEVDPTRSVAMACALLDAAGLEPAVRSWQAQPHANWSVTLAAPPDQHARCREAATRSGLAIDRLTLMDIGPGPTPSARLASGLALAAQRAADDADYVLIMQTPVVGLTHDWLARLLGYAGQPGIAMAAPLALDSNGRITDAGVAVVEGVPLDLLYGLTTSMDDLFGFGTSVHNVTAVRAVAMTSAGQLQETPLVPAFGDLMLVNQCLVTGGAGLRTVSVPDARVQIDLAPVNDLATIERLRDAHGAAGSDPYYNPHYRSDRGDFLLLEPLR